MEFLGIPEKDFKSMNHKDLRRLCVQKKLKANGTTVSMEAFRCRGQTEGFDRFLTRWIMDYDDEDVEADDED